MQEISINKQIFLYRRKTMTVTVDNYTRVLLTVLTVLLLVVAVGLWFETPTTVPSAYGRVPDSGEQLNQLIGKVDKIDTSLGEISRLLTSGKIKVQVVLPPEEITATPTPPVEK